MSQFSIMDILKKINEKLIKEFDVYIKQHTKLSRNQYLNIYLEKVLGIQIMNHTDKILIPTFNEGAHRAVDSVSLCGHEIEFLHGMVDVVDSENYIEDYLKVYEHTVELDKCQLGDMLLQYLESSRHLTITK